MSTNQILAVVLVALAVVDAFAFFFVLRPRLPEKSRGLVMVVVAAMSLIMVGLGGAFWFRIIDLG